MAYSEILNDLKKCINLEVPGRVPCFPLGLDFDIRNSGYTHRQFRENPDVMVQTGLKVVKKFDYDWFFLHPDDLIEYEDTGITIKFDDSIPPAVSEYLPADETTLKSLRIPSSPGQKDRLALHLEGLRGLKRELGDSICLTGRVAAPFTAVTLILGIEPVLMLMLEKPALFRRFMDFFLEYNDIIAHAQLEAGADALWLGDCVATSHFISPELYENFAADYADRSCRLIQKRGGIVFYHGCEKSIPHLNIMSELSFDTINIGEGVGIGDVKNAIGDKKCVMGNLDTINVLKPGSVSQIETEIRRIIEGGKEKGGYIFCTGEGVTRDTSEENVKAMCGAVKMYGKY